MTQPTFKQFLTELFDQGFDWEWSEQTSELYRAKFETEQYDYQVEIVNYGSEWYVDYGVRGKGKSNDFSATIDTEENVSSKVMATVLSIVEDFVNMVNPDVITFDAEKNKLGRADFYEKIIQRMLPRNYKVEKDDTPGGMAEFTIQKEQ